jgi:hypothetical protein
VKTNPLPGLLFLAGVLASPVSVFAQKRLLFGLPAKARE